MPILMKYISKVEFNLFRNILQYINRISQNLMYGHAIGNGYQKQFIIINYHIKIVNFINSEMFDAYLNIKHPFVSI